MKPVKDVVSYYGTSYKTGKALGKTVRSVDRWAAAGALIDDNGAVWIKTAQTNYRGETK